MLLAVILEIFAVFTFVMLIFYACLVMNDDANTQRSEAGMGMLLSALYLIPLSSVAGYLFWRIWPGMEKGKVTGSYLPAIIALVTGWAVVVWYSLFG